MSEIEIYKKTDSFNIFERYCEVKKKYDKYKDEISEEEVKIRDEIKLQRHERKYYRGLADSAMTQGEKFPVRFFVKIEKASLYIYLCQGLLRKLDKCMELLHQKYEQDLETEFGKLEKQFFERYEKELI